MKKLLSILLLVVLGCETMHAQILKDLLKVGEQILKSTPAPSGLSDYHNGINAEFKSCTRASEQVWIDFTLKNNSSSDKQLNVDANITDQNGGKCSPDFILGGQMVSTPWPKITIPAGLTVKYRVILRKIKENCKRLPKVVLKFGDDNFDFGAVAIAEPNNTNAPNVYCGLPTVQFNLNAVEREGKDIKFKFVMTSRENDVPINFFARGHTFYDTNGNTYNDISFTLANSDGAATLEEGIPIAGCITVHNVPESVKSFAMLKCSFASGNVYDYFIRIKGQ